MFNTCLRMFFKNMVNKFFEYKHPRKVLGRWDRHLKITEKYEGKNYPY